MYVIFDDPQTVSAVKLWNYAKTPSRGLKEFAVSQRCFPLFLSCHTTLPPPPPSLPQILVDDLLVFTGSLPSILTYARGILPTLQPPLTPYTVSLLYQDLDAEELTAR